jgi:hypothetical protein
MKVDKSLEEVRAWKDKIYEADKGLTTSQLLEKMRLETADIKASLKLKQYRPELASAKAK